MKKLLTVLAIAFLPVVASAENATNFTQFLGQVTAWIGLLIPFLILLASLYFFWGLTKFILKAGDEEARAEAKQIMIWGIVAVFIMVSFWGLVGFLSNTFNVGNNTVNVVKAPAGLSGSFTPG